MRRKHSEKEERFALKYAKIKRRRSMFRHISCVLGFHSPEKERQTSNGSYAVCKYCERALEYQEGFGSQ